MFSDRQFVVIGIGMTLIWLFAMTMMNLPWIIESWPRTAELLCKGDDCSVLGWISGLSGWAAVGAAWITLRALRKQIDEANRHQRENIEIQTMNMLAVARATSGIWAESTRFARRIGEEAGQPGGGSPHKVRTLAQTYLDIIDLELLRRFEAVVGIWPATTFPHITEAVEMIRQAIDTIGTGHQNGAEATDEDLKGARDTILFHMMGLDSALHQTSGQASAFMDRWQPRIG